MHDARAGVECGARLARHFRRRHRHVCCAGSVSTPVSAQVTTTFDVMRVSFVADEQLARRRPGRPSRTPTSAMRPSRAARTSCSIFMASSTTSRSPCATVAPGRAQHFEHAAVDRGAHLVAALARLGLRGTHGRAPQAVEGVVAVRRVQPQRRRRTTRSDTRGAAVHLGSRSDGPPLPPRPRCRAGTDACLDLRAAWRQRHAAALARRGRANAAARASAGATAAAAGRPVLQLRQAAGVHSASGAPATDSHAASAHSRASGARGARPGSREVPPDECRSRRRGPRGSRRGAGRGRETRDCSARRAARCGRAPRPVARCSPRASAPCAISLATIESYQAGTHARRRRARDRSGRPAPRPVEHRAAAGQEFVGRRLGAQPHLDRVPVEFARPPARRGSGSPRATRSCHSTRSSPVTHSVTGCSTCSRVFISMK